MNVTNEKQQTLVDLTTYMNQFIVGIEGTIALYHEGETDDARTHTVDILDSLGWVVDGVKLLRDQVSIDVESIHTMLMELEQALQKSDDAIVAKIFETDLLPELRTWETQMKQAVSRL